MYLEEPLWPVNKHEIVHFLFFIFIIKTLCPNLSPFYTTTSDQDFLNVTWIALGHDFRPADKTTMIHKSFFLTLTGHVFEMAQNMHSIS
jgi:hypothetical protein